VLDYLDLCVLPMQVIPRHHNAPRPPRGTGGARGGLAFFVFYGAKSKKIGNWLNTYQEIVADFT